MVPQLNISCSDLITREGLKRTLCCPGGRAFATARYIRRRFPNSTYLLLALNAHAHGWHEMSPNKQLSAAHDHTTVEVQRKLCHVLQPRFSSPTSCSLGSPARIDCSSQLPPRKALEFGRMMRRILAMTNREMRSHHRPARPPGDGRGIIIK